MNTVSIIGNLGQDPTQKVTNTGKFVTNFNIATRHYSKGRESTMWWRIGVWENTAVNVIQRIKKGDRVMVTGKLAPCTVFDGNASFNVIAYNIEIIYSPKREETLNDVLEV